MEPFLAKIYIAAAIASTAAICASGLNRLRNVPAGSLALAAGSVPWLVFAMLSLWPNDTALTLGLLCIGPLFLLSFIFYSFEKPSTMRNITAAATLLGMSTGVYFSVVLGRALLLRSL